MRLVLSRHRSALPALILTSLYGAALAVALVVTLVSGDLGPLWWVTLFVPVAEGAVVTPQSLLVPVLAGMAWAWAIWQSLRGPSAGSAAEQDQDIVRLRITLYVAAAATWLFHVTASLSWEVGIVISSAAMWVVVLRFARVLDGDQMFTRGLGVLGYGGFTVIGLFDLVGVPALDRAATFCGLASLIWLALVLRDQWGDDRWGRATFAYGTASLVAPILLTLAAMPFSGVADVVEVPSVVGNVLLMIWLARTAHDLAVPRHEPAAQTALEA
ncbi:hypothetical protein [Nonomuraea fuscirosea]|uniref:hypothetical protein n=1 Tax=Nonomuraea fuscirosea TaxID=1291556 RepID=UPI0011B1DC5C|nr:hypothetical protein [Nonomuraea fuscirosea]